jgi:trans-aconitate methyltransferase
MIGSPREWAKDFAFWLLDQRKTRGYHLMNDLRFWTRDRSVDVIFDVGANVGQTVDRLREYFPSARIEAFEPVSDIFETLQDNTTGLSNVHCHPFALGRLRRPKPFTLSQTRY